jgi:CRISPR-associated protein Csd1
MGFWQHLADSYDKNADALRKTYPLSTTSISNNSDIIVVIVIDGDGNFLGFDKIDKAKKDKKTGEDVVPTVHVTIPVNEESMGRRGRDAWKLPHPLFDQYEYLKGDGRKFKSYVSALEDFAESEFATRQVQAIYRYILKRTVEKDLSEIKPKDKTNILFQVVITDDPQAKVWENETVFNAWHQYYLRGLSGVSLDYVSGVEQSTAKFHPKKISSASANAKLISEPSDEYFYTFRGKFSDSSEAVSIGYETSQKAHQFLRYLINDRGYYCGEQVILSFTIGSTEKLLPPPIEDKSIWAVLQESQTKTESDAQIYLLAETGFDYAEALKKALAGFGDNKALMQHAKTAVIALDAGTKGRLAITFYRELARNEYLEKIADWHESCKWNLKFWDKENEKYVPYIGAPSVDKIIEAVHGKPRSREDKSYIKMKKTARERLLRCIFDRSFLPRDYVVAAVWRASNPLGIAKNGKFDRNGFEQMLSTACALVRKDYQQSNREDYKLSIELDRKDRDYLYGRLLGAADKLEEYVLFREKKNRIVTAAIRYMQAFAQRPYRTWQTIHSCLNPYIQTEKGSFGFNEIQAVMDQFVSEDYEKDTPLNGSYLIGYYHERAYIDSLVRDASKKKQSTDHKEQEGNNEGQ